MRALWSAIFVVVLGRFHIFPSANAAAVVTQTERVVSPRLHASGKTKQPPPLERSLSLAEGVLSGLPHRGGAMKDDPFRILKSGGDFSKTFRKAVAANLLSWLAVVGGTVAWSRTTTALDSREGVVRKALVGAIVMSTTVQVASNILQTVSTSGSTSTGERSGLNRGMLAGLKSFQWSYLGVLAICSIGEYIQGAHIYRVYSEKGLDMGQIARVYSASTVSAMVAGLFVGALLDRYGRRNGCTWWAVLNVVQCILIHSDHIGALILGRIIAGAAATILATSFESWMVTEHHNRGYPSHLVADTFRMATWGVGVATIASGFVSDLAVRNIGSLAPFQVAIGASLVGSLLIGRFWRENYGDRSFSVFYHTQEAVTRIMRDSRLLMTGLVQALFEGSMMTWIILWVPAIHNSSQNKTITLGTVFSTLMIALCGGSSLFKILTQGLPSRLALSPEACLVLATGLGTVALAASWSGLEIGTLLFMFLLYETCIGLYLPAMATCRSKYIDDNMRGTVMNIFRVPMNLVAALLLLGPVGNSSSPPEDRVEGTFGILAALTGVATLVQVLLLQRERELNSLALGGREMRKKGDQSCPEGSLGADRIGREGYIPTVRCAKKQEAGPPLLKIYRWDLDPHSSGPAAEVQPPRGSSGIQDDQEDRGAFQVWMEASTPAKGQSTASPNAHPTKGFVPSSNVGSGRGSRGKGAVFFSSVAGGVAATGWFLFRGLSSGSSGHCSFPQDSPDAEVLQQ